MTMQTLLGKMDENNSIHNTPQALSVWYDHMEYFKTQTKNALLTLTDHQCIKFEGDYWGLLSDLSIPLRYHPFLTMYNGYTHPTDYRGTLDMVMVPDLEALESVLKVNMTRSI